MNITCFVEHKCQHRELYYRYRYLVIIYVTVLSVCYPRIWISSHSNNNLRNIWL